MDRHAYRHHVAHPAVIFVEVPVGGSPAPLKRGKPAPYPVNQWSPWRPATRPPNRKAEATRRLLDEFRRQDQIVREIEMMTPRPDLMRAWLNRAA